MKKEKKIIKKAIWIKTKLLKIFFYHEKEILCLSKRAHSEGRKTIYDLGVFWLL